jgi:hypothetical protein
MLRRGVQGVGPQSRAGSQPASFVARAAAAWSTTTARLDHLRGQILSKTATARRPPSGRDKLDGMTKAELYSEARQLGVRGRSKMNRRQLAEAIRRAQARRWSPTFVASCLAGIALVSRPVSAFLARSVGVVGRPVVALRMLPTRPLVLSLFMLAAGGLGLVLAYAVAPEEDLGAQVLPKSQKVRIETVTGPGGTTTLMMTRTSRGEVRQVPVRVLRTTTSPGGTVAVEVAVAGPASTHTVRQVQQSTKTQFVTQPVTQVVTDVVTQSETVVLTETVVIEVTTTVPPGPPPPSP